MFSSSRTRVGKVSWHADLHVSAVWPSILPTGQKQVRRQVPTQVRLDQMVRCYLISSVCLQFMITLTQVTHCSSADLVYEI